MNADDAKRLVDAAPSTLSPYEEALEGLRGLLFQEQEALEFESEGRQDQYIGDDGIARLEGRVEALSKALEFFEKRQKDIEPNMTPEKAEEYMQAAALMAMDIETFNKMIQKEKDLEKAKKIAQMLYDDMKKLTTDESIRKSRYGAMALLWGSIHGAKPNRGKK